MAQISSNRFEGKPCRACGGTERYIRRSYCVACSKAYDIKKREEGRAQVIALVKTIFEGNTCRRCGSAQRYVGSKQCVMCMKSRYHYQVKLFNKKQPSVTARVLGITTEQYQQKLEEQNWCCAICKTLPKLNKRLSADHCHKNGNFRGLLRDKCNMALGLFNDDDLRLQKAIEYLRQC